MISLESTTLPGFLHEVSTLSSRYVVEDGCTLPEPCSPRARGKNSTGSSPPAGAPQASPPANAARLLGTTIAGRYEVKRLLGRGGMGVVFEVLHTRLQKKLALKVLLTDHLDNPAVLRRFTREALAISKLSSANTVHVYDFGVDDGLSYLVMDLVEGRTLSAVLRAQGPLGSARVAEIASQICDALSEAHAHGVIHRDIKPDNVMLVAGAGRSASGAATAEQVKVLDFGLAKLALSEDGLGVTSRGVVLGTPFYMAPEQIRGEAVDERTDVYAVGALMYRALTGHHPFEGKATDVLAKHLTDDLIPPEERTPALLIHPPLSRVVVRALARDPAERYASTEELKRAIVTAMSSEAFTPRRAPATSEAAPGVTLDLESYERRLRSPRIWWGILAGVSAVTLLAGALAITQSRSATFDGREHEPNNDAASAQALPLGAEVRGKIGRRIDEHQGDRDTFELTVEDGTTRVELDGLPNMGVCVTLHQRGSSTPAAQVCAEQGRRVERDLALPAGGYYATVFQDMDPRGGPLVERKENVSDEYALRLSKR